MGSTKKGFIMYCDLLEQLEPLTMEQRGVVFTAILCDQSDKELPEMEIAEKIAFLFIKKSVDIRTQKYNEIVEKRRAAGKQGGRPKANESKEKQNKANETKDKAKKPDIGYRITDNGKRISDNGDKQDIESIHHKHGEYKNVLLSDEELCKLKSDFPDDLVSEKIEALSSYMKSTGKAYKDHYVTLRNWIRKDLKERGERDGDETGKAAKGTAFNLDEIL